MKRLCNGPCGCRTRHAKDTELTTGNPVWRCECCGTLTKRAPRATKRKKQLDKLFNDLTQG